MKLGFKQFIVKICWLGFFLGLPPCLFAEHAISVGTGYGVSDIVPIRVGIIQSWDKVWRETCDWPLSGYWELSGYHMPGKAGSEPGSHRKLNAIAAAGSLRLQSAHPWNETIWPFIDLVFGLSYLTEKEIGGRQLGSHVLFEDRLGFGARFGSLQQFELGYRAIHFSNAYLANPNHGINLHMIIFSYWF